MILVNLKYSTVDKSILSKCCLFPKVYFPKICSLKANGTWSRPKKADGEIAEVALYLLSCSLRNGKRTLLIGDNTGAVLTIYITVHK